MQVKAVDKLPAVVSARSNRYRDAMAQARAKVRKGRWVSIAVFESPTGASQVKRSILRGERPIDGKLSEWEIETRRVRDSAGTVTGSELFVRLK